MREAGVPITASSDKATSVGVCQMRLRRGDRHITAAVSETKFCQVGKSPGQRWPRPRPRLPFVVRLLVVVAVLVLVLVLILLLRSAAVERPISAPSPNSPRSPRCTYRLSVRAFTSCRFAARRFAMTNLRARDLATAMPDGPGFCRIRSLLLCFSRFPRVSLAGEDGESWVFWESRIRV
jgi:hypothetical protein